MAIKKLKRTPRQIKVAGQETPTERQARTAVRYIMDNRHSTQIMTAIREGVSNQRIAETGITRGWFEHNQKTVVSYLQYFRKHQPGLCKPHAKGEDLQDPRNFGYDHLFDGNNTIIDEELELVRLIKLQQARLGIGFLNERRLGMLLQSNRKEVSELRDLIMELARLRGVVKSGMDVNVMGYQQGVKEDLKSIQQDEQQRSVIATLVSDLMVQTHG